MTKAFVLVFLISLTTITSNAQSGCKAVDELGREVTIETDVMQ